MNRVLPAKSFFIAINIVHSSMTKQLLLYSLKTALFSAFLHTIEVVPSTSRIFIALQ